MNTQYTDALKLSVNYFDGDEIAAKVFIDKYALKDNTGNLIEKTPEAMHHRLASEFARIECGKFKEPMTEATIFSYLDRFKYIVPQGSPMYGIGNNFQTVSLSNCFVSDTPEDSYGGIMRVDEQLVQLSKRRGGVGTTLEKLRPAGSTTHNAAQSSTGSVTFMHRYSNSIREVGQGGRRGALMLTQSVKHPDIEQFITVKNDDKSVTGANISVKLTDEFMKAVEAGNEFELAWPIDSSKPVVKKTINARKLWKSIVHSAWLRAEPGLLFWDNIIKGSIPDCYSEEGFTSTSTNPCSEIPLCPLDSCRLLVVNLFSLVKNPFTKDASFDYAKLTEVAIVAQRLMDDLVDLEIEKLDAIIDKIKKDPESELIKRAELNLWLGIKEKAVKGRRTGTGVTAVGDTLAALNIKYGSADSIKTIEKIFKTFKLAVHRSSVNMAKELGAFPVWNWNKEKDHPFLKQIAKEDPELYADMAKFGRRNIASLTCAPTGSVSLLTQTSSGIEPLFMLEPYTRRKKINPNDKNARIDFTDAMGDTWQNFTIYHPKVKLWMALTGEKELAKSPWYKCCAEDLDWTSRIELQAAAQRHIDHAISSTINLPEDVSESKVAQIYETAWKAGCKGITVYRKNCRSGVLIDIKKEKDFRIIKTAAPKRPVSLRAEIHHPVVKGEQYYAVVGILGDSPYEVFTGINIQRKELFIPKSVKEGLLIKQARHNYALQAGGKEYNLTNGHSDDNADALTRLISTSLRHGTDIAFIVHQLEKTNGDLWSFSKVLARTLKKYITDGTTVSGEECPECKSELVRENGCASCKACGYSKCA